MDLRTTCVWFAVSAAAFAFTYWRASLPIVFGKVRMIPWTSISLLLALVTLLLLVHVVNLLGFTTGPPSQIGR